jgi:hypothetical protein
VNAGGVRVGARVSPATWAASVLNRDLVRLEIKLAEEPSVALSKRVHVMRLELAELQKAT